MQSEEIEQVRAEIQNYIKEAKKGNWTVVIPVKLEKLKEWEDKLSKVPHAG